MNKNIITVGFLLSASVMSESSLTYPAFNTYSDGLYQKVRGITPKSSLNLISQVGESSLEMNSPMSPTTDMTVLSALDDDLDDRAILESLIARMKKSKPMPAEFSRIIDEDFWDLV